ncbi:hypothetical protein [Stenotrophomonas sp. NPDC078853]|uniref:hypothetical protein n=1 Tax=Stenotrophomonas sp. NPDC078853 TaxID=3364534 RepID=UPI00384E5D2F
MELTKRSLRDCLGTNDAGLAKFFNVTPSAVCQWADDDPLPEARQWQAKATRPDLFPMVGADSSATDMAALIDSRMNKRALRAKLGFKTDAPLAKVLGIEPEVLEAWAEEGSVPDSLVGAVLKLLGHGAELDDAPRRPADPDADRIVPVEAA